MFRHYVLTAWTVFMRRKLLTFINLTCVLLTLLVLLVATALLENAFSPSGVEGKSARFLQVHRVTATSPDGDGMISGNPGYRFIEQNLRPMRTPEKVAAVTNPQRVSVYQVGRVTNLDMRYADAAYWEILDFTVLAGRVPGRDDVAQGRLVAAIAASAAGKLFPGAEAVGRKINIGGRLFDVIGVVADEAQLNAHADIWAPVTALPSSNYRKEMFGDFTALLLAPDEAGVARMRAEAREVAKHVVHDDPREWSRTVFWPDSKLDFFARATVGNHESENSGRGKLLAVIAGGMLMFMLLPALNLVNLNSARILERRTEIGVRKAFGATNAQLVGQFVVENVLLCLCGGLLALACAELVLRWVSATQLIPLTQASVNLAVFAWGQLITVVFGVLSGIVPAWKMARLDPVHALKGAV